MNEKQLIVNAELVISSQNVKPLIKLLQNYYQLKKEENIYDTLDIIYQKTDFCMSIHKADDFLTKGNYVLELNSDTLDAPYCSEKKLKEFINLTKSFFFANKNIINCFCLNTSEEYEITF